MSNYSNTKATIAANVYTNHNNEVTAEMVKTGINAVVDTLIAGGFLYKGVATTSTNPGSPDANVFYIATAPGTYTNFGSLVVNDGEVAILKYNGSWSKEVTGAATAAEVTALGQEVDKKVDIAPGRNLFNSATATHNKYIAQNGTIQNNTSWSYSDYIPVSASTAMYLSAVGDVAVGSSGGGICFYDSSRTYISGIGANTKSFTTPATAAYLRFSYYNGYEPTAQLEYGNARSAYADYNPISGYLNISSDELADGAVVMDKLGRWAVAKEKTQFFRTNLLNTSDPDYAPNYFLDSNGALQSNAGYLVTGYIPFTKDMGKMIASYDGIPSGGGAYLVLYNKNKQKVAAYQMSVVNGVATWQTDVAFVRFSINQNGSKFMVEVGENVGGYLPFGEYDWMGDVPNPQMLDSILGAPAAIVKQASLSNGGTLSISNYPFYLKKKQDISFEAKITSFSKIQIGKGYNSYRGKWFEIDGTNISCYRRPGVNDTPVLVESFAHGLTFSTFIKVAIHNDDTPGNILVVLQTLGGYVAHTFENSGYEMNSDTFVRSDGSSLTDCLLTGCGGMDFPVWVFGDSYISLSTDRWPYYLKEFGFWNFMIDGYAGASSPYIYKDLQRCLQFGCPKYLVWTLGMNDSDSNFQKDFDYVTALCDKLGITFIGATIPTVPGRDKETISAYVRNSGRRYIDFYKAVGADSSGNWYAGYLSSDDVHPTALGAQALATQILIDFPEIMQY